MIMKPRGSSCCYFEMLVCLQTMGFPMGKSQGWGVAGSPPTHNLVKTKKNSTEKDKVNWTNLVVGLHFGQLHA